jgi:hypothetical protein
MFARGESTCSRVLRGKHDPEMRHRFSPRQTQSDCAKIIGKQERLKD